MSGNLNVPSSPGVSSLNPDLTATMSSGQATQSGNFFIINIATPSMVIKNLGDLITAAVSAIIVIAGLLTFIMLVWGGIEWLTSGGDKTKYEAARNRITSALVGLTIVAAAWAIMQLVAYFFGIDITRLTFPSAR